MSMTVYRKGIFPLSADPIHFGHLSIIGLASRGCEKLLVLVTNSEGKEYLFDLETRLQMVKHAVNHFVEGDNIEILSSQDLLVDVFLKEGCDVIFRGIRDNEDRCFEEDQMRIHDRILPGFHRSVHYLKAVPKFRDISSTLVRSFTSKGLDVSDMVPLSVKSMMEETFLSRYLVGITGQMGTGKTYVSKYIAKSCGATHLNIDELVRELYVEQTPGADKMRQGLVDLFGKDVLTEDGKQVDTKKLKDFICKFPDLLGDMHDLVEPHVYRLMREHLRNSGGLILLEWAQLIENDMCSLVNNNVVVVHTPSQMVRDEFLQKRGVDRRFSKRVEEEQWDTLKKMEELHNMIESDGHGTLIPYSNHPGRSPQELVSSVMGLFPALRYHPCQYK